MGQCESDLSLVVESTLFASVHARDDYPLGLVEEVDWFTVLSLVELNNELPRLPDGVKGQRPATWGWIAAIAAAPVEPLLGLTGSEELRQELGSRSAVPLSPSMTPKADRPG